MVWAQTTAPIPGYQPVSGLIGSKVTNGTNSAAVANSAPGVSNYGLVVRVAGTVSTTGGSVGLTNAELRASPVPVSGTISATQGTSPWIVGPPSGSTAENDGACPAGAANFTVISSLAGRKVLYLWASPANNKDVFVKLGTTATSADARLGPGQAMNFDTGKVWDGQVDAFPESGTQAVCVVAL